MDTQCRGTEEIRRNSWSRGRNGRSPGDKQSGVLVLWTTFFMGQLQAGELFDCLFPRCLHARSSYCHHPFCIALAVGNCLSIIIRILPGIQYSPTHCCSSILDDSRKVTLRAAPRQKGNSGSLPLNFTSCKGMVMVCTCAFTCLCVR